MAFLFHALLICLLSFCRKWRSILRLKVLTRVLMETEEALGGCHLFLAERAKKKKTRVVNKLRVYFWICVVAVPIGAQKLQQLWF